MYMYTVGDENVNYYKAHCPNSSFRDSKYFVWISENLENGKSSLMRAMFQKKNNLNLARNVDAPKMFLTKQNDNVQYKM